MTRRVLAALATQTVAIHIAVSTVAQGVDAVLQRASFDLSSPATRGWLVGIPIAAALWSIGSILADRAVHNQSGPAVPSRSDLYRAAAVFGGVVLVAAGAARLLFAGLVFIVSQQARDALLGSITLDAHDKALFGRVFTESTALTGIILFVFGLVFLLVPERLEATLEALRRAWSTLDRPKLQ